MTPAFVRILAEQGSSLQVLGITHITQGQIAAQFLYPRCQEVLEDGTMGPMPYLVLHAAAPGNGGEDQQRGAGIILCHLCQARQLNIYIWPNHRE